MTSVILVVLFVLWINFAPPLAHLLLGDRFQRPVDGGRRWRDGLPLLGPHKTLRGVSAGLAAGCVVAPFLGMTLWEGIGGAAAAMTGDLISSFIKRRLNLASGRAFFLLDQLFEVALPASYFFFLGRITPGEAYAVVIIFIPITHLGAWFWKDVLQRAPKGYPRRPTPILRLKEWVSCSPPLVPWHFWLNLGSVLYYRVFMNAIFKILGIYKTGERNVLRISVQERTLHFEDLPDAFDGYRILLLVDLHLDGHPGLTRRLSDMLEKWEADLCLIGGDIRMETYGSAGPALSALREILVHVRSRDGLLGVLGNHDCVEMIPDLTAAGVNLLINDSVDIRRGGETIWIVGLDDPHYYKAHDLRQAFKQVPEKAFTILVAHTPEAYREAAAFHPNLYLCGHTHGGQICLGHGGRPVFTHCRAPRTMAAGEWSYAGMKGYTSRGVGASGLPLRFNCPGEITLLTLRRG